jgi:hypothetical protein
MVVKMTEFFQLVLLSIACGAISMTVSKSKVFLPVRRWIKSWSVFLGEGLACPYCTSHWVAFILMLIYFPRVLHSGVTVIDFCVETMVVVAMASMTAWVVYSAYAAMTHPEES